MVRHFLKSIFSVYVLLSVVNCSLKDFTNGTNGAGSSFAVAVKVDQSFQYTPSFSSDISFPYSLKTAPEWVSINSTSGQISGVPPADAKSTIIEIQGASSSDPTATKSLPLIAINISGDPLLVYQWNQENTGQTAFAQQRGTINADLNVAPVIRSGITGNGVNIAISDMGLDINHEDLTSNVLFSANRNYASFGVSNDPSVIEPTQENPRMEDHGTSVAGVIAMVGWNNVGGRGIAPNAKIAGLNWLVNQTQTNLIDQATRENFHIVNQSWGSTNDFFLPQNTAYRAALENAVDRLRSGKGVIYVKAAGNDFQKGKNSALDSDGIYPEIINTGAVDANGTHASYSSSGANLWISGTGGGLGHGQFQRTLFENFVNDPQKPADEKALIQEILNEANLFTPGMVTTDNSTCNRGHSTNYVGTTFFNFPLSLFDFDISLGGAGTPHKENPACNYTSTYRGTSFAAPSISGVIALMLEKNPNLTWRDVKYILAQTARKVDPNSTNILNSEDPTNHINDYGWIRNRANLNFHNYYGFGLADAASAVALANRFVSPLKAYVRPANFLTDTLASPGLEIPDNDANGITRTLEAPNTTVVFTEAVEIEVTIDHFFPRDLSLELQSPSGTKSIFLN
jgi:subtilisin family serine protease